MKLALLMTAASATAIYVGCAGVLSALFTRSTEPPSALLDRPAFRITRTLQALSGIVVVACLVYWLFGR